MPRVPLPSVSLQADQSTQFQAPEVVPFQASQGQQLAGLGAAMQQAGGDVGKIAAHLQDQYDDARTKEADLAYHYAIQKHVGAYLQLIGKDATGDAKQKAMDAIQEQRRTIAAGLSNRLQRKMFKNSSDGRTADAMFAATQHEAKQTRIYDHSQSVARAESFSNSAVDAYVNGDQKGYADSLTSMRREVSAAAQIAGMGPDELKLLQLGASTQMHSQIIEQLTNDGKGTAASDYLAGAKDEIDPKARIRLEALVRRSGVAEESTRLTMSVMDGIRDEFAKSSLGTDRAPTPDDTDAAWRKAYETVDQQFREGKITAELRDATRDRLREEEGSRRRDQAREIHGVQRDAEQWLVDHPDARVDGLPPAIYEDVRRFGIEQDLNGFSDSSGRYPTDPGVWATVNLMTPQELRSMPADQVASYRSKLSPAQWNHFVARRASAVGSASAEQRTLISIEDRMRRAALQLGILPSNRTPTKEEAQAYDEWSFQMNQQLQVRQALRGVKSGDEDVQQFLDERVMAAKETVGVGENFSELFSGGIGLGLFRSSASRSGLSETRMKEADIPVRERAWIHEYINGEKVYLRDVPPKARQQIEAGLMDAGELVTVRSIIENWVASGRPDG